MFSIEKKYHLCKFKIDTLAAYSYNRILPSNKNKWTTDAYNNLKGSQGNYIEWKKSILKVTYNIHLFMSHSLKLERWRRVYSYQGLEIVKGDCRVAIKW